MQRVTAVLAVGFLAALGWAQHTHDPLPIARKAFNLLLDEKYAELRTMFTQKMLDGFSEDTLRNQVGQQIKSLGGPEKIGDALVQNVQGRNVVVFPCKFTAGNFDFLFTVDDAGKIAGLFFRPEKKGPQSSDGKSTSSWTAPFYADLNSFREREVTVGEGQWKLPGTLATPIGAGPFSGIVLVQGSGPEDRDEPSVLIKRFAIWLTDSHRAASPCFATTSAQRFTDLKWQR